MSRPTIAQTKLLKDYARWLTRVPASSLTSFACPECEETIKTSNVPGDTLAVCPFCFATFFMVTQSGGQVSARLVAGAAS